jgi:hypothetical protein
MKKGLVGCGGFVVLLVVLAWVYGDNIRKLFELSVVDPAGEMVVRNDGGRTSAPLALPVFVDPRDGGR